MDHMRNAGWPGSPPSGIHDLGGILARFRTQKIGVIGDLMLDEYVWGTVDRISPEAPVPVVSVARESRVPGGAANVAINLAELGSIPLVFGRIGRDSAGAVLVGELKRRGLFSGGLLRHAQPTTVKTRIVAHNQQVVRVDREVTSELGAAETEKLLGTFRSMLPEFRAVIISDYNKGVVTPQLLAQASQLCLDAEVPLFLDCKTWKFERGLSLTAITPNHHELGVLSGTPVRDDESVGVAVKKLFQALDVAVILVTRGALGMSLFERQGRAYDIPALAKEVFDVTGSGDTSMATFALALGSGATPRQAAVIASVAAANVVSKVGTAYTSTDEIQEAFEKNKLDLERVALSRVAGWYEETPVQALESELPGEARAAGVTVPER